MKVPSLFFTATTLVSVSQAYTLSFYLGNNCNGEPLQVQYPVADPPNYYCRGIPADADSVVIEATDGPDASSHVVFRQPQGCNGPIWFTATNGCVGLDDAQSYQVIYN